VISGEPVGRPSTVLDEHARQLLAEVRSSGRPQVHVEPNSDGGAALATVIVAMPDRPGALSAAAGVLALHSLEVHAAELASESGIALDQFTVSPRFGGLPDVALLRAELARVLDGTLDLSEAVIRKERDYARPTAGEDPPGPRVLWFDDEATGADVLELRGPDRIGLLHRVAAALERCGADVRWARVSTLGASVVDSFCLAGAGEGGTLSQADRSRIATAVLAAVRD
jgi:[protein-PII] uridylyltransferase